MSTRLENDLQCRNEAPPSPAECAMHTQYKLSFIIMLNEGVGTPWLNIPHMLGYSQKLSCLFAMNIVTSMILNHWLDTICVITFVGLSCTAFDKQFSQAAFFEVWDARVPELKCTMLTNIILPIPPMQDNWFIDVWSWNHLIWLLYTLNRWHAVLQCFVFGTVLVARIKDVGYSFLCTGSLLLI